MSGDVIDQPRPVRKGEELDTTGLDPYLRERIPSLDGSLQVEQFPGGHSNLTYALRYGQRELVLRRPPFGASIKSAHDMGREYRVLSHLSPVYPPAPRPLLYCEDVSVLGAPFYVMERITGVILRPVLPAGLDVSAATMRRLSEAFVDNFVRIHGVDVEAAGLRDLGHPGGYVARQIRGWTKRYRNARTDDVPEVERAAAWLDEHLPTESGAALIHNDYKYDNLVLDPRDLSNIVGVLDWEMCTVGDPLMDLGSTLAYWVDLDDPEALQEVKFGPTNLPGNLTRAQIAQRYAELSGRDLSNLVYYYVYGLFKLAVIVQQIYFRYYQGFTQDRRFANMVDIVRLLGNAAVLAIEKQRIDRLAA